MKFKSDLFFKDMKEFFLSLIFISFVLLSGISVLSFILSLPFTKNMNDTISKMFYYYGGLIFYLFLSFFFGVFFYSGYLSFKKKIF